MRESPRISIFFENLPNAEKIEARRRINSLPPIGVLLYCEEEVAYFTSDPSRGEAFERNIVFSFRDIIFVIDNHHGSINDSKCYSLRHQKLFYGDPGVVNYFFAPLEEPTKA